MLDDSVCIVCGGGRGLGEATAKLMAEKGANVVVNDLGVDVTGEGQSEQPAQQTVEEIKSNGNEAMVHFGDVTDLDYTEKLIRETVDKYGAVHSITNFAGVLRDRMVFNMTEDEWDTVIHVHLKGHFSLLHNAASHWRQRYKEEEYERQRSFLGVSSAAAKGNPGQPNYSAAKAGILGLMRNGSRELNQYNVRVNALWPGALTRMTEDLESIPDDLDEDVLGPQLVAPAPVFYASEAAEGITGTTLSLSGGDLSYVSDPVEERTLTRDPIEEGGWTPEEIEEVWDDLTEGFATHKTDFVGM